MSSAPTPESCADQLARQLGKQAEICLNIKRLSESQQAMVADRKEDELLSLLNEKQLLIDQHQQLFAKTQELRDRWEGLKSQASPAAQAKVETAWEKLKAVLNDVVSLEDASRGMLQEQKDKVSDDISKIQRGKVASKAYGGGMIPPPQARYSDKQG